MLQQNSKKSQTRQILKAMNKVTRSQDERSRRRALRYLKSLTTPDEYAYLESFYAGKR
jgi:hypothetical protein